MKNAYVVQDSREFSAKLCGRLHLFVVRFQLLLDRRRCVRSRDYSDVNARVVFAAVGDLGGISGAEFLAVRKGDSRQALQQGRFPRTLVTDSHELGQRQVLANILLAQLVDLAETAEAGQRAGLLAVDFSDHDGRWCGREGCRLDKYCLDT